MSTTFLILLVALLAGVGILTLRDAPFRQSCIKWFYLFCGALAWYTIETATRNEPIHIPMLIVLLLCLIPMIIDSLLIMSKSTNRKL
jgi:hypothetical protein